MDQIVYKIEEAVRECAQIMLGAQRTREMIDEKSGHANFVTTYDKAVQEALREKLLTIVPDATFVGEEDDVHSSIQKGDAFIVDPIDGTTNFIRDYHCSAISVGMTRDGESYIGVIYNPYLDEMFSAQAGCGAYLNGKPIHVSREDLSGSIILFGSSPYYPELRTRTLAMLTSLIDASLDVRRSGSAALDFCSLAAGRAELFFEMKLSPWDYAAGSLILTEAGGKCTTIEGEPITLSKPCSILADNGIARLGLR